MRRLRPRVSTWATPLRRSPPRAIWHLLLRQLLEGKLGRLGSALRVSAACTPQIKFASRANEKRTWIVAERLKAVGLFDVRSNPALDLAPFGRWTLRDKAAQRRSALR